jgi:hypothetical protein
VTAGLKGKLKMTELTHLRPPPLDINPHFLYTNIEQGRSLDGTGAAKPAFWLAAFVSFGERLFLSILGVFGGVYAEGNRASAM